VRDRETTIGTVDPDRQVRIEWAADALIGRNADQYREALRAGGLPSNVQVDVRSMGFVTDNRRAQYRRWLEERRPEPTLLMIDSGWTLPFAVRGQLQNLSRSLPEALLSSVRDRYPDPVLATATWEDELFAVPAFVDLATVLYRRDLVEAAGYSPRDRGWATDPPSWREFTAVVADAVETAGTRFGFTLQADAYEGLSCCTFNELMTTFGGAYFGGREHLFGPVGDRRVTVDAEPSRTALRLLLTLLYGSDSTDALPGYEGGITPTAALQWTEGPSLSPFAGGEAVAHRNWTYAIRRTGAEEAFGERLGVMPIPYGVRPSSALHEGTGGTTSALGGWHVAINPYSPAEKQRAAVEFLRAMATEEFMLAAFSIQGWIPPVPDLLGSTAARETPVVGRYVDSLRVAMDTAMPRPVTPVWPEQSSAIAALVYDVLIRERNPGPAMGELADRLRQIENEA